MNKQLNKLIDRCINKQNVDRKNQKIDKITDNQEW